jgi:hypothetical protein
VLGLWIVLIVLVLIDAGATPPIVLIVKIPVAVLAHGGVLYEIVVARSRSMPLIGVGYEITFGRSASAQVLPVRIDN